MIWITDKLNILRGLVQEIRN